MYHIVSDTYKFWIVNIKIRRPCLRSKSGSGHIPNFWPRRIRFQNNLSGSGSALSENMHSLDNWRLYSVRYTAKTQYRKFEPIIPRKGIEWHQSQFPHSCVCERFIYSHNWPAFSTARKYVDQSWEFINLSHTHECGNWCSDFQCLTIKILDFLA